MNDALEALVKMLRQQMNDYCDQMALGGCRTYDEYQHLCGRIRGLQLAEEYAKDLAKKLETADDDDE